MSRFFSFVSQMHGALFPLGSACCVARIDAFSTLGQRVLLMFFGAKMQALVNAANLGPDQRWFDHYTNHPTVVIACMVNSSGSRSPHRQPIPRRLRPRGRSRPQRHEQTSPTLHSSLWCLHGMARIKSTMSDNYLRTANFDSSPRKFSMPSRRFARALLISCLASITYRRCNRATGKSACDGASSPRSGSP